MDENTLSEYGWIVVILTVIVAIFIFAPGLGNTLVDGSVEQISSHFEENNEVVTYYTEEDIDESNGLLVAIGETDAMNVVARFTDDYTSVIITKNGAESDGIMADDAGINESSLVSVTIAEGVINVAQNAFADCANLKGVDIATSVATISEGAFSGCTNLMNIAFAGTEALWNDITFVTNWNQGVGSYKVTYNA